MTEHTLRCQEGQAAVETARQAYIKKYPNYCRKCKGTGSVTYYDSVPMPFGSGNCSMSTYEFCDACQGEGRCARCGEQLTEADTPYDEYLPCPACGWKDGDEGLPEPWECACWRDEVEELRAEEFNLVFSREFYPDPFGEEDINYGV